MPLILSPRSPDVSSYIAAPASLTSSKPSARPTPTSMAPRSFMTSLKSKMGVGKDSDDNPHPQHQAPATRRPTGRNFDPFTRDPRPPPPSYDQATSPTAAAHSPPPALHPASTRPPAQPASNGDSAYEFLRQFDTLFLIDDSGSMAGGLWRQVSEVLASIAPTCTAYDADGIEIRFLNSAAQGRNVRNAVEARELFQTVAPRGQTPTAARLRDLTEGYVADVCAGAPRKPLNVIVITDGEANDCVESVLASAARRLDAANAIPWQLGVQFVQVGSDPQAAEYLRYLDDELAGSGHGFRDIVDTVCTADEGGVLSEATILKIVLGAVNRRLDKRSVAR